MKMLLSVCVILASFAFVAAAEPPQAPDVIAQAPDVIAQAPPTILSFTDFQYSCHKSSSQAQESMQLVQAQAPVQAPVQMQLVPVQMQASAPVMMTTSVMTTSTSCGSQSTARRGLFGRLFGGGCGG